MRYRVLQRCGTANRKFLPGMEVDGGDLPTQMDGPALLSAGVLELIEADPEPEPPAAPIVVITETENEEP